MRLRSWFVLGCLCAALAACGGGGGSGEPPGVTPETLDGVPLGRLAVGPEIEVPDDLALIIEVGCTECDGPTERLIRVYRDASGELRTDALFEDPSDQPNAFITSFALSADASTIAVGVCPEGDCPFLGPAQPGATSVVHRSTDGGVTWQQLDTPGGVYYAAAVIGDNVVLQGPLDAEGFLEKRYEAFPGGAMFDQPVPQTALFMVGGGEIVWRTVEGRLLRVNGGDLVRLPAGFQVAYPAGGRYWFDPTGGRTALALFNDDTGYMLGLVAGGGEPMQYYRLEGYATIGGWLDADRAIGNAVVSSSDLTSEVPEPFREAAVTLPAIFDFSNGTVQPIAHPFLEQYGRNRVVAVLPGPFARVTGAGDCLNVRSEPGQTGEVLDCFADGVLLRDRGEERSVDGVSWLSVTTPDGIDGWATVQYLER